MIYDASLIMVNCISLISTFLLPIKFTVDMQNLFKNAFNTLSGNEISIKVNGNIKVGKANVFMNMPVNYEGKHRFSLF